MKRFAKKYRSVIGRAVAICINALLLVLLTLMGNTLSTDKNGTGTLMKQLDVVRQIYVDNFVGMVRLFLTKWQGNFYRSISGMTVRW